jgi:plasmid segregation protein ParM
MAVNLAVDAGRSEVKAKSINGLVTFSSAVSEAGKQLLNPQNLKGDLEIELDGKRYWVGDLADREGGRFRVKNYGKSKAQHALKVQVIAAAIYSGLAGRTINLGVLVPITGYTKEERKAIRELLKGTHHVRYWLVEEHKKPPVERSSTITINDKILITQEAVAAYWSSPQNETTQTLDFGAQTINYAFHRKDRVYINDMSGTIDQGWEILKEKHGLRNIPDDELNEKEARAISEELVKKVVDEVKLKGWDSRYKTQVFGGVAHLVSDHVAKYFPNISVLGNPRAARNANVNGLYNLINEVFKDGDQ